MISVRYKNVALNDIEKASGLTRGAVFYYARNKEALFREIIDNYLFNSKIAEDKQRFINNEHEAGKSLHEFIHRYVKFIDSKMQELEKELEMSRAELTKGFFSLVFDA